MTTLRNLIFTLALLFPLVAAAQYTNVTATVTDPNNLVYANCKVNVSLLNLGTATPLFGGQPLPQTAYSSTCNANGTFTVTLPSNTSITNTTTQWTFNITAQDGITAFSSSQTITGASQNISAVLSVVSAVQPCAIIPSSTSSTGFKLVGSCVNPAQALVTGTLTSNVIPVASGPNNISNSLATDNGTVLGYAGTGGFQLSGGTNAAIVGLQQGGAQPTTIGQVGITVPSAVTAYNITLPAAAPTTVGFVLTATDTNGGTAWQAAPGAGSVSISGTPVAGQVTQWNTASQIKGTTDLTFSAGNLGVGVNGGTSATLTLNGATSGNATISANATATLLTLGGTAFTTLVVPNGSATAVSIGSAANTGLFGLNSGVQWSNAGTLNFFAGNASVKASGNVIFSAISQTGNNIFQGGIDGSSIAVAVGSGTFKGADILGGSTSGGIGGANVLRGGDNAQTGATEGGGALTIRPGQVTSATPTTQNNGVLTTEAVGIKGATYTSGNLQCVVAASPATGVPPTYGDCTVAGANELWVGVAAAANGNSATVIQSPGYANINSSAAATFTFGHSVCLDGTNAAKVVDGGTTRCTAGQGVGVVAFTDSSVTSHWVHLMPY